MPATPEVVGAYLAAAALPTLHRRVAAIARACAVAGWMFTFVATAFRLARVRKLPALG